jgi:hypothetical protein
MSRLEMGTIVHLLASPRRIQAALSNACIVLALLVRWLVQVPGPVSGPLKAVSAATRHHAILEADLAKEST